LASTVSRLINLFFFSPLCSLIISFQTGAWGLRDKYIDFSLYSTAVPELPRSKLVSELMANCKAEDESPSFLLDVLAHVCSRTEKIEEDPEGYN
jgi:hypothetical protein